MLFSYLNDRVLISGHQKLFKIAQTTALSLIAGRFWYELIKRKTHRRKLGTWHKLVGVSH